MKIQPKAKKLSSKPKVKITLLELEERWYKSLKNGFPDFYVYDTNAYVLESINCWENYSKDYLRQLEKNEIIKNIGVVKRVVDLGCGIGYTTACIKQLFPEASVFGTNTPKSRQFAIAKNIGEKCGFEVVESVMKIRKKVDVVFAFEYFEHFHRPVEHLEYILDTVNPKHLIIANSFNSIATGHFPSYYVNEEEIEPHLVSRKFNTKLRERGYNKIDTGLWNDRPTCWRANES